MAATLTPEKLTRAALEMMAGILEDWFVIEMNRVGLLRSNIIKAVQTGYDVRTQTVYAEIPRYHIYIEAGRRPGARRPPIAVILKWVIRKFGSADANRKAYAIANAIAKRGIRPRPFTAKALENAMEEIAEKASVQLRLQIDDEIRNILYR